MSHFINGQWVTGEGVEFGSHDPISCDLVWEGRVATINEIEHAAQAAHNAFTAWSNQPMSTRYELLQKFTSEVKADKNHLARVISEETGKPLWESHTEVDAVIAKCEISYKAYMQRTGESDVLLPQGVRQLKHKPHGVMAVLGPFNFPAHLPNGHMIPALLAGNTLVFKPSPFTPKVAETLVSYWEKAGCPPGVINLIQGNGQTGQDLIKDYTVQGVLFTGSYVAGKLIHQQFAGHPEKLLALEMGGNNPLIIGAFENHEAAAYLTIQSAFVTAGQRCTCARRLIIPEGEQGDRFLAALLSAMSTIKLGHFSDEPEPFMGSLISREAAQRLLSVQEMLAQQGASVLMGLEPMDEQSALLSPALIDVTHVENRIDAEYFGPLLQIIRVADFAGAIEEANNTKFGLAAGLFSDDKNEFDRMYEQVRAGIINWNTPLTGASSAAPFGGVGFSGNYHPSAFYAADYCAYPSVSTQQEHVSMPKLPPGLGA